MRSQPPLRGGAVTGETRPPVGREKERHELGTTADVRTTRGTRTRAHPQALHRQRGGARRALRGRVGTPPRRRPAAWTRPTATAVVASRRPPVRSRRTLGWTRRALPSAAVAWPHRRLRRSAVAPAAGDTDLFGSAPVGEAQAAASAAPRSGGAGYGFPRRRWRTVAVRADRRRRGQTGPRWLAPARRTGLGCHGRRPEPSRRAARVLRR